ncbi:hypothetical protein [Deinococcus altitudinis]|uniref:hypothetical protein n=1 Tax=Deinococcus altitudinis TaxID=468914 RepID=UPI0038911A24
METTVGAASDSSPNTAPATAYAVISELTEGISRPMFDQGGKPSALKEMTVLVTLYGAEGSVKADLRPVWLAVKRLQGQITSHPGIPHLIGQRLGASLPPSIDPASKRPMAGIQFILNYRE